MLRSQRANEDTDTETGNMKTVVRDENITLCLWANLEKNPRYVCVCVYIYQDKHKNKTVSQNTWDVCSCPTAAPRFKGLNFDDTGFGFELPKQLAVSDVAVRILHTRYDHLSLLAWMTHAKIHTANQRSDITQPLLILLLIIVSFMGVKPVLILIRLNPRVAVV